LAHPVEAAAGREGGASGGGGPRLGALDDYIGFHLQLAQAAAFRSFKRQTGIGDLRAGWFTVLSLIGDNPGITPIAISRASGRDKSTITPVIQELVRSEFIVRETTPGDRRSYGLRLTEKGRASLDHLAACAAEHDGAMVAIVGEHREALIAALRRIVAELG
jgi:DNA-binding MarR family transcriptional regulator